MKLKSSIKYAPHAAQQATRSAELTGENQRKAGSAVEAEKNRLPSAVELLYCSQRPRGSIGAVAFHPTTMLAKLLLPVPAC